VWKRSPMFLPVDKIHALLKEVLHNSRIDDQVGPMLSFFKYFRRKIWHVFFKLLLVCAKNYHNTFFQKMVMIFVENCCSDFTWEHLNSSGFKHVVQIKCEKNLITLVIGMIANTFL
jgi:hypothetical protein